MAGRAWKALLGAGGLALIAGALGAPRFRPTGTAARAATAATPARLPPAPLPPAAPPQPRRNAEAPAVGAARSEADPTHPEPPADDPSRHEGPSVIVDGNPRAYALTRNVWVKPKPSSGGSWIGFLWWGSSVRLSDPEPVAGSGCAGQWYGVEPRGYVCVDDERATLDPHHPVIQGVTRYSPELNSPWPHQYGKSIDARVYRRLPSKRRQRAHEWYHHLHEKRIARVRAGEVVRELVGIDLTPAAQVDVPIPELPPTLQPPRTRLKRRSTVAWTRQTSHEDRSFLLTSDLKWIPKDRVIPYPTVTFQGVHLGQDAQWPIAFFRKRDRPAWRRAANERFERAEQDFVRLSWVELTGRSERVSRKTYLETRSAGLWVKQSDAVLPRLRENTPWGTPLDAEVDPRAPKRGRKTWMEASIMGGWLLAYEGRKPVFATLIAAGRGGPPQGDLDPVETASTPVGRFKITGKFATATMVAPTDLVHSDVPWAQNFSGPHALHAAYWHDGWGELRSGGCLNVSPRDGEWLFKHFTEPSIPDGWHGVRWLPKLEPATTLLVRKR